MAPEITEPEQSFKTISIRNGHSAYLKRFRYSYQRHMPAWNKAEDQQTDIRPSALVFPADGRQP
jgi:hypothetical protein